MSTTLDRLQSGASRSGQTGDQRLERLATAALLLYPLARLVLVVAGGRRRLQANLMDDAYYYLRIAGNVADGHGSTFGLVEHTNGYHPLWQIILTPVAAAFHGTGLLVAVNVVQTGIFIGFLLVCLHVARQVARQVAAGAVAALAFTYALAVGMTFGGMFFQGMENALTLLLLMLLIAESLRSPISGIRFGLLSLGLILSRLDTAVFPVLLLLALVFLTRPTIRDRWATLTIPFAGLAVYAVVNQAVFGTFLPTSGQAKALGGGAVDLGVFEHFFTFGRYGPLSLAAGAQAVAVVAVALLLRRRGRLAAILAALMAAQVCQLSYYQLTSSWNLWPWYYYYLPPMLFLSGLVIASAVTSHQPMLANRLAVPVTLLIVIVAVVDCRATARAADRAPWYTNAATVGEWLRLHIPPDATVAIGDRAGLVGWTFGGRVLQLEGLVQAPDYLSYMRERRITDAMTRFGVSYYIRSDGGHDANDANRADPQPTGVGCASYVEPAQGHGPKSAVVACNAALVYRLVGSDGSSWSVWRYQPELQGG